MIYKQNKLKVVIQKKQIDLVNQKDMFCYNNIRSHTTMQTICKLRTKLEYPMLYSSYSLNI